MEFVVTFLIAAVIICALYLLFTNGRELLFGEQPISQEKGLNLFAVLFALIGGVIFTFVLNFNFAKGYKFSESVCSGLINQDTKLGGKIQPSNEVNHGNGTSEFYSGI